MLPFSKPKLIVIVSGDLGYGARKLYALQLIVPNNMFKKKHLVGRYSKCNKAVANSCLALLFLYHLGT